MVKEWKLLYVSPESKSKPIYQYLSRYSSNRTKRCHVGEYNQFLSTRLSTV